MENQGFEAKKPVPKAKTQLSELSLFHSMAAITRFSKPSAFSHIRRCLYSSSAVATESNAHLTFSFGNHNITRRDPSERNVQWVFLGAPGVGKGTYASRLSNLLGVPHIATGDLVREELASSGPLSKQVRSFSSLYWPFRSVETIYSFLCNFFVNTVRNLSN